MTKHPRSKYPRSNAETVYQEIPQRLASGSTAYDSIFFRQWMFRNSSLAAERRQFSLNASVGADAEAGRHHKHHPAA